MSEYRENKQYDVVVLGSGAAGLAAALAASVGGLRVAILEKSRYLGGSSAMSGAGTFILNNHVGKAAGFEDSESDGLLYLESTAPEGWREQEEELWAAFVANGSRMLKFLEEHTPLRFELTVEPDPMAEYPGGKLKGRNLTPAPLSRWLVGRYRRKLRPTTIPHLYTYHEIFDEEPFRYPVRSVLRLLPKMIWRILTSSRGQGTALVTGLLKGCMDRGCEIFPETPAQELTVADGRVTGVKALHEGREVLFEARHGVVLATGGFEWDPARYGKHFPGVKPYLGSPDTNTGDGQRMAEQVGAELARMDQANIYPTIPTLYEKRVHRLPTSFQASPYAIVLNRHGERFLNEYDYSIGEKLNRRDPETGQFLQLPCWAVGDSRFISTQPMARWFARFEDGWLVKASSVEELARKIDLPVDAVLASVRRFNTLCEQGRDDDFHRGESAWGRYIVGGTPEETMGSIVKPPFYAIRLDFATVGTKGGARTNAAGEVKGKDGAVIPGLYAAGLAMANPIGTRSIGAGTTIGPNLTWGYICGQSILKKVESGSNS